MIEYVIMVLLIIVLLWFLGPVRSSESSSEHMIVDEKKPPYSAGASMRKMAQEFSGTNQEDRSTFYNAEVSGIPLDEINVI